MLCVPWYLHLLPGVPFIKNVAKDSSTWSNLILLTKSYWVAFQSKPHLFFNSCQIICGIFLILFISFSFHTSNIFYSVVFYIFILKELLLTTFRLLFTSILFNKLTFWVPVNMQNCQDAFSLDPWNVDAINFFLFHLSLSSEFFMQPLYPC